MRQSASDMCAWMLGQDEQYLTVLEILSGASTAILPDLVCNIRGYYSSIAILTACSMIWLLRRTSVKIIFLKAGESELYSFSRLYLSRTPNFTCPIATADVERRTLLLSKNSISPKQFPLPRVLMITIPLGILFWILT